MRTITINRKFTGRLLLLLAGVTAAIFLPQALVERPQLTGVSPSVVTVNSEFNMDRSLLLTGEHLENAVAVYVNEIWVPESSTELQEDGSLKLYLPAGYYANPEELRIRIQTKVTGELFARSNAAVCRVSDGSELPSPVITGVSTETLRGGEDETEIFPVIQVSGENFDENSRVLVGGRVCATTYADGSLTARLPYSAWYDQEKPALWVSQCYEECPTGAASEKLFMTVESPAAKSEDEEEKRSINESVMVHYLRGLRDDSLSVFLLARDEASSGMTDSVRDALEALGLQTVWDGSMVHHAYIAVIDGGTVQYEQSSAGKLEYRYEGQKSAVELSSSGWYAGNRASVILDGQEYAVNGRGLNIIVYDNVMQQVVDSVSFDTFDGLAMSHR